MGREGGLGQGKQQAVWSWQEQLAVEEHLAPKAFLGTTKTLSVEHGIIGLEETFLRGKWKFAKEILF